MYVGEKSINMGRGPQGRGNSFAPLPEAGYVVGQAEMKNMEVITGRVPCVPDGTGPRAGTGTCRYRQNVGAYGLSKEEKEEAARVLGDIYSTYVNSFKGLKEAQKLIIASRQHLRNYPASAPRLQPLLDKANSTYQSFQKLREDSTALLLEAEKKGISQDFFSKTRDQFLEKATVGAVKYKDKKSGLTLSLSTASSGQFGAGQIVGMSVHMVLVWVVISVVATSLSLAMVLWAISLVKRSSAMQQEAKNKFEALSTITTAVSVITKMVYEGKITAQEGAVLLDKIKEAQADALTPLTGEDKEKGSFLKKVGGITLIAVAGAGLFYAYKKGWLDRMIGRTPILNQLPRSA